MAMDRTYSELGGMDPLKASIALEAAVSQKEGKAETKLEKDRFGGIRKMRQNL